MKVLIIFAVAISLVQIQAERDWSNVTPLDITPFNLTRDDFNLPSNPRIVGGEEAVPNSIPYQAALFIKLGSRTAFCGGSIISEHYILTAAHCVDKTSEVEVVLGAHKIHEDESTQQHIVATEFIVHPGWSPLVLTADIALIKLPEPIQFNDAVQPIRLPRHSDKHAIFTRKVGRISGWGKDSDKATAVSPILRNVNAEVISELKCKLYYFGVPGKNHICTSGTGRKGACSGDSGGPLAIVEDDGQPTVVGIVSFGLALGCEIGWPSAFTRVPSYLSWINQNTGIDIRD